MEAEITNSNCPNCKYTRAQKSIAKDGSQEHFICHRCGYLRLAGDGKKEEHQGLGSWMFVAQNGIGASAVYIDNDFFNHIDELKKAFKGGKLFYTKKDSIGKYLLVDSDTNMKYAFGDDVEVCIDGLRKIKN